MRTLIYTTEFPPYSGGVGSFSHAAATGLRLCGRDVVVLAPGYGNEDRHVDAECGFPVIRVPEACRCGPLSRTSLLKAMRQCGPDVLLLTNAKATRHLARLGRPPCTLAIYLHGNEIAAHFDPQASKQSSQVRGEVQQLVRGADRMMAVCQSTADLFAAHFERHGQQADVVHLGVDPGRSSQPVGYRAENAHAHDGLTVLCVARLAPGKGHDVLLRAFDKVRRRLPQANLRIAGDGPCRNLLEDQTRSMGFNGSVKFLGNLGPDRLGDEYRRCDLFTMVSRQEAFPTVFLEANAHGKASVAGRTGGVPEVVQDGITGVIVDPHDVQAVADAIIELLNDPAKRRKMGEAARQRVLAEFTHKKLGENLVNVLDPHVSASRRNATRRWATRKLAQLKLRSAARRVTGKTV